MKLDKRGILNLSKLRGLHIGRYYVTARRKSSRCKTSLRESYVVRQNRFLKKAEWFAYKIYTIDAECDEFLNGIEDAVCPFTEFGSLINFFYIDARARTK